LSENWVIGVQQGIIERCRRRLPVSAETPVLMLREGATPLVRAEHLAAIVDAEVWLKVEGLNPTGSFKDRGMTVALSKAKEAGSRPVICASTGNTSASAAAYAARGGLTSGVLVPEGKIALGKLAQALVHGARLLQVQGNFDDCLDLCRDLSQNYDVTLVNSVNPYRIEGQKTAAFAVRDTLGDAPDTHCLPVGTPATSPLTGRATPSTRPTLSRPSARGGSALEPAGAAPIVSGVRVAAPQTIATAIRIGNPASSDFALAARDDSRGGHPGRHRPPNPVGLPAARTA
jgi:threonine synthase